MNPRTTGLLLLVAAGLAAFLYFYEVRGEDSRLEAEQRAKALFRGVEADDVAWIELRTSDGADVRLEQQDREWRLARPIAFPADMAAARLADALGQIAPETTIDEPQPDAEYGLDDASARIVRFGGGERAHELRFGARTPVGANVYVRGDEPGRVHIVAAHHATAFERTLDDLRDKQILDFDTSAVRRVEAAWPGGRIVALREAGPDAEADTDSETVPTPDAKPGWRLRVPLEAPADPRTVDRLLTTLAFLRAEGFADEPTAAQQALFEPPDFDVSLATDAAEAAEFALSVSQADADGVRWVRTGDGPLYRIPAARIDDFPRRAVEYRDRRLARFTPPEAQQIDFFFQAPGGDPVVIHAERAAGGWTSQPETFETGKISALVTELARLEADEVVAESLGADELDALGLSPPQTVITVLGARPASGEGSDEAAPLPVLAEIHLGQLTPRGVIARVAGQPVVWRLSLDRVAQIPIHLENFRSRFRTDASLDEVPDFDPDAPQTLTGPDEESL